MIRVEQAESLALSDWKALVKGCQGNPLHLPMVHLAYHSVDDLRYLTFRSDGPVVACAIALATRPGRLRWPRKDSVLTLPTAPALCDTSSRSEVWSALLRHAKDHGCDRLQVAPAWGRGLPESEDLAPYRTTSIQEFVVDLRRSEEEILAGMHKYHRKNIRRAAKEPDLSLEEDNSLQGLLDLRDLQMASSERASQKSEGFGVGQQEFFEKLHRHMYAEGPGHVLFAKLEDRRVAALAWLAAADRVLTVRSGSLPEGYQARVMYRMHEELIRWCLSRGVEELNIGAVPVEAAEKDHGQHGLYEFKAGFGGQASVRHGLDIPLKEIDV